MVNYKTSAYMNKCRGFVSPLLIALIIAGVMGVLLAVQTHRLESCKAEHAAFVAKVEAAGKEQERRAQETEAADKKRKEKADAENKTSRARIAALSSELRDARARSRFVPEATATASGSSRACYGRDELDGQIQRVDAGVSEILTILGKDAVGLNTVRAWAAP